MAKIIHIVPHLHTIKGGMENFGKSIYFGTRDRFESEIIGWESRWRAEGVPRLLRGIVLRHMPAKVGAFIYRHILSDGVGNYKTESGDLVHFWSLEPAITFPDTKCIISCHGMELLPRNVSSYERILYQRALSNALVVHVCSQYTARLVSNQFGVSASKIAVIPPPVDFDRLSSFARGCEPEKDAPVIGTLARFVRRKNLLNVIRALNVLSERHHLAFTYYLAGDGLEREAVLSELRQAKFDWKYFGEISDELKEQQFYPALDVFVLPPLELSDDVEGFGIVYLEANAYGIPVVASRTGGVSDAVMENFSGVFADPEDPGDIASRILELVENRKEYRESTKHWAERFDISRISVQFCETYRRAMAQIS